LYVDFVFQAISACADVHEKLGLFVQKRTTRICRKKETKFDFVSHVSAVVHHKKEFFFSGDLGGEVLAHIWLVRTNQTNVFMLLKIDREENRDYLLLEGEVDVFADVQFL
jgi:hypothetical protein